MRLAHCLLQFVVHPNECLRPVMLAAILLAGCASQPAAPVSDQSIPVTAAESGYRVVVPGDTLYSIAWEAGHDYQELAAWNNISKPYRLHPGQRLRLTAPPTESRQAQTATPVKKPAAAKKELANKPKKTQNPTKETRQETRKEPAKTAAREKPRESGRTKPADKTARPETTRQASTNFGPWVWPAEGKILNYAGPNGSNKGLDIAGSRAQTVRAAAPGRVVYVGNGLRGYGLLVIVKHDEEFLSAYAHSDKVYVKEGDVIKRGDKIADMGSSGADRVKLHFEIRRRGVPVDPLQYLPKK